VINVLAAAEWGGEFEGALEPINALFSFEYFIDLGPYFSINRTILIAWLMTAVAAALFIAAFRDPKVIPGKFQSAMEMVIEFVRGVAIDIIGPKGHRYVPLLTTLFVAIFVLNIAKITPFLMLPPTSRMAWPAIFAGTAWLVYVGAGIKEQGFGHYFKELAFPPGVPKPLYLILTPIELISGLILRPFTLAVRLFANMVAGHILVVITLVTIHVFLYPRPGLPIGIFALIASPLVFGFELLIIGLQAYIFIMLTSVYISSSVDPAH
jgi:F-type H+-transporting ATPase subunit a